MRSLFPRHHRYGGNALSYGPVRPDIAFNTSTTAFDTRSYGPFQSGIAFNASTTAPGTRSYGQF